MKREWLGFEPRMGVGVGVGGGGQYLGQYVTTCAKAGSLPAVQSKGKQGVRGGPEMGQEVRWRIVKAVPLCPFVA